MRSSIIFDFDDTLIVSRADRGNVLIDALNTFGVSTFPDELDRLWGRPFAELVTGLAPETRGRYQEFLTHYAEVLESRPPTACPGVVEALPLLREHHHLFVHSASHSVLVRTDLQSLGVLHYFDFVCGSEWQLVPKPDPRSLAIIVTLLEAHGQSLDGCWYVGDSPSDGNIAAASLMRFVAVRYDEHSPRWAEEVAAPEHVIRSVTELISVVD